MGLSYFKGVPISPWKQIIYFVRLYRTPKITEHLITEGILVGLPEFFGKISDGKLFPIVRACACENGEGLHREGWGVAPI